MAGRFFARQKQKLLGKNKTVDEEFEQERKAFGELKTALKEADKQSKKLDAAMKALVAAGEAMTEHAAGLYEDGQPMKADSIRAASHESTAVALSCSDAVQKFQSYVKTKLELIHELDKRVSARDDALLWHDSRRDALAKAVEAGKKTDEVQKKFDEAVHDYTSKNAALKVDLAAFSGDKTADFQPELQQLTAAQLRFARDSASVWSVLAAQMS